jgi:hypothetical protein
VENTEEVLMTTEDIITLIFLAVDDKLPDLKKHSQAKLYPSEVVTIGILMALKGVSFRAFYRWLKRDYRALFPGLPERSRLQRLLKTRQAWAEHLLSEPSFFSVIDSYPIELIFPVREGRSDKQIGKKGRDKGRWSIGVKLCWLINEAGKVVAWSFDTMNVSDKTFNSLVAPFEGHTIVLADYGFRDKEGTPSHMKFCPKNAWNERMCIETAFSMLTNVCNFKKLKHRAYDYISARLAFATAMFNVLLELFHTLHPQAAPFQMSIAEFSL